MSKKISLKQFLMRSGAFDRVYDCAAAIKGGKITVDGKTITNPSYFFNPKKSHVRIGNKTIRRAKSLYYMLNKPAGYLSQKSADEKTIYDLISDELRKSLFAVGRLDKETEGLMLLTNDGKLASLITNPRNKLEKKYYAVLEKPLQMQPIEKLKKGVKIKADDADYMTKPAKIKSTGEKEIYITIIEGRKRQIRKMLEAVGNKVVYLKRISIGGITLKDLKPGELRQLTREELYENLKIQ